MIFPSLTAAVILLQLALPPVETISEIRFEGNKRTRPETLLREMLLAPGDPADANVIETSRQAIMDLELFKSVEARLEPGTSGVDLVVTVEEKRYFFVLPALGRSADGDITYGAEMRFENLQGRNHHVEIEAKQKNLSSDADVDDERTFEFEYLFPRMRGGPWELDTLLRYQRALLEETRELAAGDFERSTARVELLASRWRRPRGPSRGWRYGGGVSWEDFKFDYIEGDPTLFFDTREAGLLGRFGYRNVRNFEFNRDGRDFEVTLDVLPEFLGAERDRFTLSSRYRRYNPVTRRRFTNLDYQIRAAMISSSQFGDPTFDLAGSSSLRGYPRGVIEGDAFIAGNVEFVTPISKLDALRGAAFVDAGSLLGEPDEARLLTAAGVGLRWKLRAFVRVDLRVDVAYGFDGDHEGETKVYAGTDSSF